MESHLMDPKIEVSSYKLKCIGNWTLFFLSLLLVSCAEPQGVKQSDACWWVREEIDFKLVKQNAKTILTKSTDSCVIDLIDKLVDSSSSRNGREYIKLLGEFRKVSDGYVSEYFNVVGTKLFYISFEKLFDEMYNDRGEINIYVERIVVQSIGTEISDAVNREEELEKLESFIEKKKRAMSLSKEKEKYLKSIKQKILAYIADDEI